MKFKKLLIPAMAAVASMCFMTACASGGGTNGLTDDLKFDEYGDPIFFNDDGSATTLKVWSIVGDPDNAYLEVINTMFNDYYSQNGVRANITSIANGDFYTQLTNTINTDAANAPDIVIYHSERLPLLASNNLLRPINEFYGALGEHNTFSTDNYLQNVIEECYYKDTLYGVPLDVHSGMWYVRQDILEKNGLQVPTSLSELVDVCNAVIQKYNSGDLWYRAMRAGSQAQCAWKKTKDFGDSYSPIVMSNTGGIENGWIPQSAVYQNGGTLTDSEGKPAWNTDALANVMGMFRDWQSGSGSFKDTPYAGAFVASNNSAETVWSKLSSGEAIFSFEGPWWAEQRLNEYEEVLGDLEDSNGQKYQPLTLVSPSKMFALDETSENASKVYGVGHCFSISKTVTSKSKCVAAALYAQYMTENSAEYTRGGHIPASKKVLSSEQYIGLECYDRYLSKLGNPEDFVMLGGTEYYSEVYEKLKSVYIDTFTASYNNITIQDIITARYNEAMRSIQASEDL